MEDPARTIELSDLISLANFAWTLFVALIAASIFILQRFANKRRVRFENTFRLIDRLETPEMVKLRHDVKALSDKHGGLISWARIEAEPHEHVRMTEEALCSEVSKLFGYAGFLSRKGEADHATLIHGWSRHIIMNYRRLWSYLAERDKLEGGAGFAGDFAWLYKKAVRYAAKNKARPQRIPEA